MGGVHYYTAHTESSYLTQSYDDSVRAMEKCRPPTEQLPHKHHVKNTSKYYN